jgi:WhiB family redox-sensing transcriptional regulator
MNAPPPPNPDSEPQGVAAASPAWLVGLLTLRPVAEEWLWQQSARCRGEDPRLFFHPDNERGRARARRQHRAKAICDQCPVVARCREHSLKFQEPFGVWGGLSEGERVALLAASQPPAVAGVS